MKYITALFFTLFAFAVFAQPGNNDPSFNPGDFGNGYGDGANGNVYVTAKQSDGKILIGGAFTTFNGVNSSRIARLNTDGSIDAGFTVGTGFNNDVWAIAIQSDGKIIVGGYFTLYNGTAINRIIRLNSDGTRDNTFAVGTGANAFILSAVIQSDGKIIIAGNLTSYNGTASNYIARLNSDGSYDTGFTPGTGANSQIQSVSLQSDGKIIIGGAFTSYNGTGCNYVARLNANGTLDTGFNTGTGASASVSATAIQSDGKILISGTFTTVNGTARNRIARLNSTGSLDNTFTVGTGANNTVSSIAVQTDGKIVLGGDFTTYNANSVVRVVRVNTDGSFDNTLTTGAGAITFVSSVNIQSDGKIIIGGFFTSYDGTPKNRIARLNSNGSIDAAFNVGTGANSFICTMAVQANGKIIIGGDFTSYNGTTINRIARLNSDGSIDNSFNPGTGANAIIYAVVIQSDGKIIIGGDFTSYNGTAQNYIARLNTDGSLDATFNVGTGTSASVYAIALQSDGKVIAGGNFTTYNGTARNRITRINTNGTIDNTFAVGTGANATVNSLAIQSDGKVLAGGNFTSYAGTTVNRIVRLSSTGSIDATFNVGSGAGAYVFAIAMQSNGKVIIGGTFTTYNGTTINRIARLNTDGSIDNTFNVGTGVNSDVKTILIQGDGRVLIAGNFTTYNGVTKNRIVRLNSDGTINSAFNIGAGTNSVIRTSALQSDLKILIAGDFVNYKSTGRNRVARIYNCADTYNTISVTECDSYTAPDGTVHTTSGVKTATIPNSALCDSVITINLTIKHSTSSSITVSQCNSYTAPDGTVYTTSGIKTATIPNSAGCDSVITINLTIRHSSFSTITVSACNSYTAPGGTVYTTSGVKTATIPNAAGCDSVITINLTIKQSTTSTVSVNECDSYTAPDGAVYTTSGIKTAVIPNAAGCDSTITINLTIKHSTVNSISVTECDSYTAPDGVIYSTSGIRTATIPNSAGCDSVITINLTINNSSANTISLTECDSYTAPDGVIYTTSGIKTAVIANAAGCDSTITIDLTINHSTASAITVSECDSYTAPDGTVYTTSGIKTAVIANSAGCDSTITINLSVKNSTAGSISENVCDSYTAPDGTVYTTSGIKTAVIANYAGCDSTITIDLTVNYSSDTIFTVTACNSYTAPDAQTYFVSGIVTAVIPNSTGCDSTITINLTIQNPFMYEEICLVTVDTILDKNRIIWEKTPGQGTYIYNIYSESSPNIYNMIGQVLYTDPAEFVDNFSAPSVSDTKYKISVVDTCGNESAKSGFHKTIKVDISGYGNIVNLNWTEYVDEDGSFIPLKYYIYRGTQADNMTVLDSISGSNTNYTDNFAYGIYYYRVSVRKSAPCSNYGSSSFSNTVNNSILVNVNTVETGTITISPNPMTEFATLTIPNYKSPSFVRVNSARNPKSEGSFSNFEFRISDLTGKVVRQYSFNELKDLQINSSSNHQIKIDRGDLKPGIYFVEIMSDRLYRAKLVVE